MSRMLFPSSTMSKMLRTPRERPNRASEKRKRRLTAKQERRRIDGLRILARIIARHYLANPHLYRKGAAGEGLQTAPKEGAERIEGSRPRG